MSLSRSESSTDPTLKDVYELIDNPITCGYLHAFCESEYSAENIKYIIEINGFRDAFRIDRISWTRGYKELDHELKGLSDEEIDRTWPSQYISEAAIREKVDKIYSVFIDCNGDYQICFPHSVLERTMWRLDLMNHYGPDVFEESLIDPLKTMKRDIIPRFLRSPFNTELQSRLKSIESLPAASELEIPIPPNSLSFENADLSPDRKFHLHEVVECRILYTKFLTYLQGCFCSENLICYRLVTLFEEKMAKKQPVTEITWDIYRFFVAEGSAFEISLEYSNRKSILLQLAKPKADCFLPVKKSAYMMLKTYFASYKTTADYRELANYVISKQGKPNLLRLCLP
mmetsp:Transcript_24384/g.25009  ORF Transcript_24384/g.25009 Transcript_24384/m.25009 type:complete len:343 (-) Transcript_24384:33-1061(-)